MHFLAVIAAKQHARETESEHENDRNTNDRDEGAERGDQARDQKIKQRQAPELDRLFDQHRKGLAVVVKDTADGGLGRGVDRRGGRDGLLLIGGLIPAGGGSFLRGGDLLRGGLGRNSLFDDGLLDDGLRRNGRSADRAEFGFLGNGAAAIRTN